MRSRLIDLTTKGVARVRKRHVVEVDNTDVVKVNIGSGLAVTNGWINVDASLNALVSRWPRFVLALSYRASGCKQWYSFDEYCRILREHDFVHYDIGYGIPFADESVDFLYSCHFLEHLFRPQARFFAEEACRVLAPGGVIRVCVPDLDYALSLYRSGEKREALCYLFADPETGHYSRRKYMYDYDLLRELLREGGFQEIERCSYRIGRTPDLASLDNRPDRTLFVEAIKERPSRG